MMSFCRSLPSVPPSSPVYTIRCAVDAGIGFLWAGLMVWPYKNHNILDLFICLGKS